MSESATRAINKAVNHWKDTKRPPKSMEVPEWGLTVYWNRWTLGEKDACRFALTGILQPMHFIRAVVEKAIDKDGKKLFAEADITELQNETDPRVVERIGATIIRELSADYEAIDDGKKKD